jgi:parvulin-like peptidyl-prolyl isomerase
MATRKDSAKKTGTPTDVQIEQNRKHERLRQRDLEQHRRLYLGVGIAIAAAIVFMAIGLINEFAFAPRRVVAMVGEDRIIASDFGKRVKMEQSELTNALRFYALQEQQFGNQGIFSTQINQLQATLASPFALGQQTLDKMIQEIIIRREAEARGITVSDVEVDEALREEVAGGLGLVTEPQATATAEAGVSATATAELWTPTPEPTADISVSAAVSGTDGLTGTEGISATDALSPTAEPAPTLGPAPVITETSYTEGLAALETSIRTSTGMNMAEYREIVRSRLLADKVEEAVAGDQVATTEEQVNARHILISEIQPTPAPTEVPEGDPTPEPTATATAVPEGEPTPAPTPGPRTREEALALAQELRTRIVDGGEDWMTIAAEYSDDLSNRDAGGDLGWFGRGAMVAPFEEAAFALPVGEISEPISTTFGYHLIEVLERDDAREKDEATVEQERSQAFSDWLTAQVAAANVTRNDIVSNLPRDLQ